MAVTQADIDALQAQVDQLNDMLADGVRQVTVGEQTITYNTTDSLIRARDDAAERLKSAKAELAAASAPASQPRSRVMMLSQGGRGFH